MPYHITVIVIIITDNITLFFFIKFKINKKYERIDIEKYKKLKQ